jgi:hypothetical protein
MWGAAVVMPAAPYFLFKPMFLRRSRRHERASASAPVVMASTPVAIKEKSFDQETAARGVRLRELRWKNSAWLATAETIAGWKGFEIRNAGSGRSPVRKRSG